MIKLRVALFFLISITICVFATSCTELKNNVYNQTIPNSNSVNSSIQNVTTDKILPDIPDADYGGYEFNILVSLNSVIDTMWNDFHAEEETGEALNDAIYKRNRYVEDKYNIKIVDIETPLSDKDVNRPDAQNMIKKSVQAGDNAYDAAMLVSYAASELALGDFLLDMNDMDPIDLSKPWWDVKANEDLMLKNKMFYTTGDISNAVNQAAFAIMFNKKLVQDYSLDDPYELVKKGEWTYDKLNEMCINVSADLNGDGKYDFDDRYGALIWGDTMLAVVNSIGEKCVNITSDGKLDLTLNNERIINSFTSFIELAFNKKQSFQYQNNGDWSDEKATAMFQNNQALFFMKTMQLAVRLRAMDTDFGILPYPKLDAAQEDYYTTISSWDAGFICVPASQEDTTRTATILEALAAESAYTVKPAYYDLSLKGKYARDEESVEMLDLIFKSKTYDLGWFYRVGKLYAEMMYLNYNYNDNFTSMYEKNYEVAINDINKINEAFTEILN